MDINEWINKNYNDLKKTVLGITKNHENSEDLLHEVILDFIQKPIAQKLVDENKAKFFIIRMILNQYHSKTSNFYRTYKRNEKNQTRYLIQEWWESIPNNDDYNIELDKLVNLNLDIIEEMLLSKEIKEKNAAFTIMLWFSNDMNFAEVARCIGVSRSTYRRQFDNATKIVLEKMKNKTTELSYKQLPLKLFTTQLLKGYGKKRRY